MSYDLKSENEVKEFLHNLGVEYRFGCYSEKKPEVCHLLGDYLESVKKDYQKAAKVYQTNCEDNCYGKSCLKIGTYCLLGKGGVKENFLDGYKYLDVACKQNEVDGCFNQGLLLITNNVEKGVDMDILKGMQLLDSACNGKNANACYYLSGMYISGVRNVDKKGEVKDGQYLVKSDMSKAHRYALEGCNLGNIYSCANLSRMYAKGDGVEKNQELADKYRKIALEIQEEMQTNKTLSFQEGLK